MKHETPLTDKTNSRFTASTREQHSEEASSDELPTANGSTSTNGVSAINQARMLKTFQQLVSTDSPSFGERQVCTLLQELLARLDLHPVEDDAAAKIGGDTGNLYTFVEGSGPLRALPPLLFCAHMDTVEPSRGKRAVVHADGRITSADDTVLGADDVSGLTAILEALACLKESGLPHRPLELLFSAAEEPYCAGIAAFDFSRLKSKEAYVLDLTGPVGGAALAAPTLLTFRAEFKGRAAHAGFAPEQGIHAIKAAGLAVSRIACGHVDPDTTVNIGTITGGKGDNIVPERCVLTGEVRSFSDARAVAVLEDIKKALADAAKAFHGEVTITTARHITAYRTAENSPTVQRFLNACKAESLQTSLQDTHGGSDNNHLALHGIEGIVLATAMNNCHSCEEYSDVQELAHISELILRLMTSTD